MDKKLFEENGNVKRTLKYIYVPVIKNAFKFDNEKYDVIIKDLNFIPFYEEQKFDAEKRYKVAKILNMYNLAEYLGILPNEKIYPDLFYDEVNLSANVSTRDYVYSSYEYNEKLKNFIKWYNRQNIDFIVFNVENTEQTIEYWRYSLKVELKDIFRDMPNYYLKVVSKIEPWLILKPNKDYSYLKVDSRDYICPDYDLRKDYYEINSMYIISYLLGEYKIPDLITLDVDYKPFEFKVYFEVDGEKASFYWEPHGNDCDYCINIKYLFTDLVASYDDYIEEYSDDIDDLSEDSVVEYLDELYNEIIQDNINVLSTQYDFEPIVCGRSGGYFGFNKNAFTITDKIKVKVNYDLLEDLLYEHFPINKFYDEVIDYITDTIEESIYYDELEEYSEVIDFSFNDTFIEFNKDLYRIIKVLSSAPQLRSWEEYDFWCKSGFDNEKLNEYRKEQKKEVKK